MKVTTCIWTRTVSRAAPSGAVSIAGAAWCPVGNRPLSSGPLEVLGGAARCQDSYQDWVALYCWVPFHAALMAAPEGSRCRWEQIGSAYSELSACTELLAQLFSCPWPSTALDAFFLQVHAEYFSNCSRIEPPGPGGLPPGLAAAAAVGLGCLVPLAAAFTVSRAWRGARSPAGSGTAPSVPVATLG
ncbi:receptor activity-modifying protein 1-like [Cygnus olor]|uniref:receptor activity-modifying protein 1-like n=1 Tax=Cygnus olor TaxID=8869 RepID=UPI001ADE5144|nr:receptor activity-modifying protein 1-like [Cygnus olor]